MSSKAYNYDVTPVQAATKSTLPSGKGQIKFRGSLEIRGRKVERTIVAQGSAADLIRGKIRKGRNIGLRLMFDRAPGNAEGQRGGEFMKVVALPRAANA